MGEVIGSSIGNGHGVGIGARSLVEPRSRGANVGEPLSRPDLENDAIQFLAGAAQRQIDRQRSGEFDYLRENPLGNFESSSLARQLLIDSANEQESGIKDEVLYRWALTGKVFELVAYGTFSAWAADNVAIISPEDTLNFFQILNPRHETIKEPGSHGSVGGIYVPDGLRVVMENGIPIVIDIFEYTTDPVEKVNGGQLDNVHRVSESMRSLADAEFSLVFPTYTPEDEKWEVYRSILEELAKRNCITFNFTPTDYQAFARDLIERRMLTVLDPATPEDVVARMQYEKARGGVVSDRDPELLEFVA